MEPVRGTVAALWRWPVESMAGERVDGLRVDGRGAGGDRTHAVTSGGEPLTAREAPRLLAWSAAYPFNLGAGLDPAHPPFAVVTAPDGHSFRWGDPRLRFALENDLGRPVELVRDVETVRALRVTTEASLRELDGPIDARANIHLDLGVAEEDWPGAQLAFAGGVRLRVLAGDRLGVDARVLAGGRIGVGETVELIPF
jgi:MOSC domain-containing protein